MTLQQLQYFRTLARIQHYTKASQILFISQPSLSYAMSELEKELSVSLFEKQGKKISLSPQGEVFLKYVDESLDKLNEGLHAIKELNPYGGRVNLGYVFSLSASFLPEMLLEFYRDQSNKNITFNFTQNLNSVIMEGLGEGGIDLAFCPKPGKDLPCIPILRQELFAIVPKDHPLADRKEIDIGEIKDDPMILMNKKSGLRWTLEELFKNMGIKPVISCEAEDCNAVITFVSLHFGVSIIPKVPGLENSDVSVLRIGNPQFSRIIFMAWKGNRELPPPVRRIKDFIADNYKVAPLRVGPVAAGIQPQ